MLMLKKRMKKILTMLLVLCFTFGTFAGCGKSKSESSSDASTSDATNVTAKPEQTNTDPTKLRRLVPEGETITLKAWRPTHTTIGTRIEGWGDTLFNKWMEEKTGVHIEWIMPVGGTEADNLAMLISSGEYPDLFFDAGGFYSTGVYGMMKDGVVIDVAQYLDKLPNYKSQLEKSDLRKKESFSDDKKMASLYRFNKTDKPDTTTYGILMRKDLLDKVKMDVPKTYDEWYTVLSAFKNQLGIEKPFLLNSTGFPKLDMFTGGLDFGYMNYGGAQKPFYQVDGVIHYAPLEAGFKQYLQMMNKWYSEKLIDQDFLSLNTIDAEISTFSNPMSGGMIAPLSFSSVIKQLMADDSVDFVAVPNPVKQEGDKIHIGATGNPSVTAGIQISTKCKNMDIALQWCDMYYSNDVIDISNWGPDDTYYTKDESGACHFNDKVFANEDGFAAYDMIFSIADYPCIIENDRLIGNNEEIEKGKIYDDQNDNSYALSDSLTLTDEESAVYNSIMPDVIDYVEEMQVKYIMGIESFDNYDAFVSKIREMKVEDAMAAYQSALKRYNSR